MSSVLATSRTLTNLLTHNMLGYGAVKEVGNSCSPPLPPESVRFLPSVFKLSGDSSPTGKLGVERTKQKLECGEYA